MTGFLFKNWKLFLDIVLVVGGILAFTFWDPIGIFHNKKLQATANMVKGVRDIGQLITAEYYGEVISSWKEFKLTEFPEDTISENAKDLLLDLKITLDYRSGSFKKLFENSIPEIRAGVNPDFYFIFITFIGERYFGYNANKVYDEKDGDIRRKYERKILAKLFDKGKDFHKLLKKKYKRAEVSTADEEYDEYLFQTPEFMDEFYNFYLLLTNKHLETGSNKRKEIIFIGRGWVKAGFDFGKLNEGNFMYDESSKSVHFFGIKPVILDTDINPWFIPERKIKGFELVDYSGEVDFEDAKAVKKQCKEKLLDQAKQAEIIHRALENGKEALKNFFALILDEPDIKVKFHTHPFDLHYAMIAADTLINIKEAIFIRKLYQAQMKKLNAPQSDEAYSMAVKEQQLMKYFIHQLKELNFLDSGYRFNFYSMYAAEILKDTFHISLTDRKKLIALRDTLKVDPNDTLKITTKVVAENPIWFDEDDFRYEFNRTIDVLGAEAISIDVDTICEVGNKYFDKKRYSIFYKDKIVRQGDTILLVGKDLMTSIDCDPVKKQFSFFDDIQYDMNYKLQLNDTLSADTLTYILNQYLDTVNYTQSIDTLNRAEMQMIIEVEKNKALKRNTGNPINDLVETVENFIEGIKKKD
jgi:hypothetical protein